VSLTASIEVVAVVVKADNSPFLLFNAPRVYAINTNPYAQDEPFDPIENMSIWMSIVP